MLTRILAAPLIAAASVAISTAAFAATYDITIRGSDAIFLAGRTDVIVPPAADPWTTGTILIRHGGATPEEIQETMPPFISVASGDVVRVLDPASGGINFFNGFGPPFYGPEGSNLGVSELGALDGISGYKGPQGALAGVFLTDAVSSSGPAPATIDFSPAGVGTDLASLNPLLGQVFYIGNGLTSGGSFKEFVAPAGATRLFLGIPDGFGFVGLPGAYDDNDGAYRILIGVNQVPVPEPGTYALLFAGLGMLAFLHRRRLR